MYKIYRQVNIVATAATSLSGTLKFLMTVLHTLQFTQEFTTCVSYTLTPPITTQTYNSTSQTNTRILESLIFIN